MKFVFFFVLISSLFREHGLTKDNEVVRIGIIGGGIGGTSCAFFLKSLFEEHKLIIDLYEAEKIGGRLSLVNFSQNLFEEGGSIIHSRNKYMSTFLHQFKLFKRENAKGYFALYNGHNFIFSESTWAIKTLWDVIYRYGFGFWKLKNYIDDMLSKFDRIYDLQNLGETFDTVGALLEAMDPKFVEYLHISTKMGFEKQGMSEAVINEIIMATITANYGQDLNIPKMVGSVSVAGAVGHLWAVHGGNVKIPECLLKASKANLIRRPVVSIKKLQSGEIEIVTNSSSNEFGYNASSAKTYDFVVLAAPQTADAKYRIDFKGFDQEIKFLGKYHKTVCTLVEGRLAESYFPTKDSFIDEILTTKEGLLFNSIGQITPVDYTPEYNKSNVWKIFTQKKLKDNELLSIFSEVKNKHVREWLAYPHYESRHFLKNDSFIISSNLYYINAIEWAASAMEMSAIAAKNVALLIHKNFRSNKIDQNTASISKINKNFLIDKTEL